MLGFKILILFITTSIVASEDVDALTKVYQDLEIIPNYMDKPPEGYIRVTYDGDVVLENGMEIKPIQTKEPPTVDWTAGVDNFYTLLMICPDAPTPQNPYLREWIHWFVVNIPGTDLERGEVKSPHITVLAPKDKGPLRYMYFIFQQPDSMEFEEPRLNNTSIEGHGPFNTMKFAEKYSLGRPIASLVFQAQYDDYVNVMFEQLHIDESSIYTRV